MNRNFLECEKIKVLLEKYFDAVYRADIDVLKMIFHEKATMNGYLGDSIVIGTPQIFFDDLQSKPSMQMQKLDCRAVIKNIEVVENIATASLFVDNFFGLACVHDSFSLIRENGQWYIVCKAFTTI